MNWKFWKRAKQSKRGRPAKSPLENLERRVKNLHTRLMDMDARHRSLVCRVAQLEPTPTKETGDGK